VPAVLPMPNAWIVTSSPGLTVIKPTVPVAWSPADVKFSPPPSLPVVSSATTQLFPLAGNVVPAGPVSVTVSPSVRPLVAMNEIV
jgi:hypothetical protein